MSASVQLRRALLREIWPMRQLFFFSPPRSRSMFVGFIRWLSPARVQFICVGEAWYERDRSQIEGVPILNRQGRIVRIETRTLSLIRRGSVPLRGTL